MLSILHTFRTLRLTSNGRLVPWLGPALRGLAGRRLKSQTCRHNPLLQQTRWKYCKGCPHAPTCAYGQTLEAFPVVQADRLFHGQQDGFRPLVIAPVFPLPRRAQPGEQIPVRVTFVGRSAGACSDAFWSALAAAGSDGAAGLDPDHTTFQVGPWYDDRWVEMSLPDRLEESAGSPRRLWVRLTSPLFLRKEISRGRHRLIETPSFADLFRASMRVLGGMNSLYGQPLDAQFAQLKTAAEQVRTIDCRFKTFRQLRHSHRTHHQGLLRGIIGWGLYANVPQALIPWMAWGGALHVGSHRVAGAGGWDIQEDDDGLY